MHNLPPAVAALRQLVLLALLGFAVVTLSGPLVALASVALSLALGLLSFALVGFLILTVFRALYHGQRAAWDGVCRASQNLGRTGRRLFHNLFTLLAFPFRVGARGVALLFYLAWVVLRKSWTGVRVLSQVSLMTLTGVFVGVLMGLMTGGQNRDLEAAVFGNAVVGGLIALVAGVILLLRERRAAVGRTA